MEQFADYGHAILSVVLYAILAQVLNAMTGIRKGAQNMAPGEPHTADYDDPAYRLDRAYMNSVEIMGIFAAVTFGAILAGASPFWINLMAAAVLVMRVIYTAAYFGKWGKAYGGLRTILAVLSAVAFIVMAVLTVAAVF